MSSVPEWITEAAKEIDLKYGDMSIAEDVAKIILERYSAAQQSVQADKRQPCGHPINSKHIGGDGKEYCLDCEVAAGR